MKYVSQTIISDDCEYIKNIYQFYSINKKTKLRWKRDRSNRLGFKCDIVRPPLKQCKKDRFVRVCEKRECEIRLAYTKI